MTARRTPPPSAEALRARFAEAPLTMLDAVRAAGLAGGAPDLITREALATYAADIGSVPRAELAPALLQIVTTPQPMAALEAMSRAGLMARLLPEVENLRRMPAGEGRHKDVYRHTLLVVARTPPDPITRMAALLHDIGKPATKVIEHGAVKFPGHAEVGAEMARRRLRDLGFDRPTAGPIVLLVALHLRANSYEAEWTDSAVRRLAREAEDQLPRLLDLSRADVTSARRDAVERALRRVDLLEARIEAVRTAEDKPESPLDGSELMALFGRPPGRWIGEIKARLAALVGGGDLSPDDKDRAASIARDLIARSAGGMEGERNADGRG